MKQFELTLVWRDSNTKIKSIDKIEADNLIHLLSQFNMMVLMIQQKIADEEINEFKKVIDDDIPF